MGKEEGWSEKKEGYAFEGVWAFFYYICLLLGYLYYNEV
jgi:hypothetical protein